MYPCDGFCEIRNEICGLKLNKLKEKKWKREKGRTIEGQGERAVQNLRQKKHCL